MSNVASLHVNNCFSAVKQLFLRGETKVSPRRNKTSMQAGAAGRGLRMEAYERGRLKSELTKYTSILANSIKGKMTEGWKEWRECAKRKEGI